MKRVLISLLSVLVLFAFSLSVFADGPAGSELTAGGSDAETVGYSDSRVVTKDFTNVKRITEFDATDKETTEYVIGSVNDWKEFSTFAILSSFEGITIYLGSDLDFTGVTGIRPIGGGGAAVQYVTPFAGTFDGQGYTINNLTLDAGIADSVASGYWGLFALLKGGTIKNLVLGEGCTITNLGKSHFRVGGIVGAVQAEKNEHCVIDNCWNKATVNGNRMVGGIVGHVGVSENNALKNDVLGKVTSAERDEAYAVVEHVIRNCTNTGTVHALTDNVGGISGHVGAACDITNCRNAGKISADALTSGKCVGGIAGMFNPSPKNETSVSTVSGCINNGELVGVGAGSVGGIVGFLNGGKCEITQNSNYGSVTDATEGAKVNAIVGSLADDSKADEVKDDNTAHASTDTDATLEAALKADSTISGTSSTLPEEKGDDPAPGGAETTGSNEETTEPPVPIDPSRPSVKTEEITTGGTGESFGKEKGCASVVSGVPVLLAAMAAGFVCFKKRRR